MTIGDGLVTYRADNVIDYGQYNYTTWNGGICSRCGARYLGSHYCPYWPVVATTVTYIPTVVAPDVTELLDEVKKLRKELKRARKGDA